MKLGTIFKHCSMTWPSTCKIHRLLLILTLFELSTLGNSSICTNSQSLNDFRVIQYEDLISSSNVVQYYHRGLQDFTKFEFDTQRRQLIVGARDHLLRLRMDDLSEKEVTEWAPDNMTKIICHAKGQQKADCHNFIRVLLIHNGQVFTCGTHAYKPSCTWRNIVNLGEIKGNAISGVAKCPYNPHHNNTALMTSDGNFFSGTVTDFTGRDHAIYRQMGSLKSLRTAQYNSKWLNEPHFVSSYEVNDMIYFFFREPAVEYINCGKAVFSRVARVCKNDPGGKFALLEDNWTTFMKARLNCSKSGQYPFYFNELQSTYLVPEEGLIYAVFTTSPNSIYGSAVCVFNLAALETSFAGPLKYQATTRMAWERVGNSHIEPQCPSSSSSGTSPRALPLVQQMLTDASKYQLSDSAVQPRGIEPLATAEQERWSHIAVDVVRAKHSKTFHVVFVANLRGSIKKMIQLPNSNTSCTVEEIHLFPKGHGQPIRSMKIKEGFLYIGTKSKLMKVPVQRCNRFTTIQSCKNSMDPYCGWNNNQAVCETAPGGDPQHHHWHQRIESCPVLEYTADGQWSSWSGWNRCEHVSHGTVSQCFCRTRQCTNPPPMLGGQDCFGVGMAVTNCTVDGKLSQWSDWSGCSETCGQSSLQHRKRQCSSPAPQFGGRDCSGEKEETRRCISNPNCPFPSVDGQWSGWSEWTECTSICGGGIQQRTRRCDNPSPSQGGRGCVGNVDEWKICNSHMCLERRKSSPWTSWNKLNITNSGYLEQRYKFICKAHVPDDSLIRNGHIKSETRFCAKDGGGCQGTGPTNQLTNIDGGWAFWSEWTPCDKQCNGGKQWRERQCSNPEPQGTGMDCIGHPTETKECNLHSCQGVWSCWSEFSACEDGLKWRRRSCESSIRGRSFTISCSGKDRDELPCEMESYEEPIGWKEWTLWSVCSKEGSQFRKRQCALTECTGKSQETRACLYNEAEIHISAVKGEEPVSSEFSIGHIIGGAVAGFVLGGVIVGAIFFYLRRREQRAKPQHENEKNHKNEAKPNLYMTTLTSVPSGINLNNHYCSNNSLNAMNNTLNTSTLTRQISRKDSKKETAKEIAKRNSMRTNLSLNDL